MPSEKKFPLQYAMEIWGIEAFFLTPTPCMQVAQKVKQKIEKSLGKNGTLQQVGVSILSKNTHSLDYESKFGSVYAIYVKFEVPPPAKVALQILSDCLSDLNILRADVMNPFSNGEDSTDDCDMKTVDTALKKLKQNQQNIKQRVTEGAEFALVENDSKFKV